MFTDLAAPGDNHPEFIFVQYFNPEISDLYGNEHWHWTQKAYYEQCVRLTRYAFLIGRKGIVMPASYLFEVGLMKRFLREIAIPRQFGLVHYASSSADLSTYRGKKRTEYRDELVLFPEYAFGDHPKIPRTGLVWTPRIERSASGDISARWRTEVELNNGFWRERIGQHARRHFSLMSKLEDRLHSVPTDLHGRAFIFRFVEPLLPFELGTSEETKTKILISAAYLDSYLSELNAAIFTGTPLGDLSCGIPKVDGDGRLRVVSWLHFSELLDQLRIRNHVEAYLNWYDIVRLRADGDFQWLVDLYLQFEMSGLQVTRELMPYTLKGMHPIREDSGHRAYSSVLDHIKYFRDNISKVFSVVAGTKSHQLSLFPVQSIATHIADIRSRQSSILKGVSMRESVDIALIVALEEEFSILQQHFGAIWQPELCARTNEHFYRFLYTGRSKETSYTCVAALVGRMGQNEAASVMRRVVDLYSPQCIVNLGIAGALKDTRLCDIVIAEVVDNYLDNAKATRSELSDGISFQLAGEPFRPTREIVNLIKSMEFAHPQIYTDYLSRCSQYIRHSLTADEIVELGNEDFLRMPIRKFVGHVASGPIVGADEAFARFLLGHDRNYLCLEMESGGILCEIESSCGHLKSLVIRGISDFVDIRKDRLEHRFRTRLRSAAMHNAIQMFRALLHTGTLP